MRGLNDAIGFKWWLDREGYGYLAAGVGSLPAGDALFEIARRAGVRGLKRDDVIWETLPMVAEIIKLRCKPAK